MAVNTEVNSIKWKSVLRDLYDSEELRIKSDCSKAIRTFLDELCTVIQTYVYLTNAIL